MKPQLLYRSDSQIFDGVIFVKHAQDEAAANIDATRGVGRCDIEGLQKLDNPFTHAETRILEEC